MMPEPNENNSTSIEELPKLEPWLQHTFRKVASQAGKSPRQHFVLALLCHEFGVFRPRLDTFSWINILLAFVSTFMILPTMILLPAIAIFALSLLNIDFLLYAAAFVILVTAFSVRFGVGLSTVHIPHSETAVGKLWLGRFNSVLEAKEGMPQIAFVGSLIACHFALVYCTSNHIGIPLDDSISESAFVTADNVFDGVFLGIPSVFSVELTDHLEKLEYRPAIILSLFRMLIGGFLGVAFWAQFRRWRLRRSFSKLKSINTPEDFIQWMKCHLFTDVRLPRTFFDEIVFLHIAMEYINGNFDLTHSLATKFSGIEVENEVRKLFVHPVSGSLLFPLKSDD